eukprot:403342282
MWAKVLTLEETRRTPMARLQQESKEDNEIRLIVWETRDIPPADGREFVNIQVKVSFDPTGWSGSEIEKQTDTHNGSKDGRGVFNWRFKFDIQTPWNFPRLKFQIYDNGWMNDQAMGEAILNLKKTVGMLQKEGRLDIPKTWIQFFHPNKKNEDCCQALISIQIISKQEAEQQPVGEAQQEPNENPRQEVPVEGRGIKDAFLSATNLDVGKFRMPKFNMFRNFIILGVIVAVVIIVLILIMFLR